MTDTGGELNAADLLGLPMIGPEGHDVYWDDIDRPFLGIYDRGGNPISMRTWARLLEFGGRAYKAVRQEQVGEYWVSTVWLGFDHSFRDGPPLIFETMVFKGSWEDLDMDRYSTEEEAVEGHERMVEKVRLMVEAEA